MQVVILCGGQGTRAYPYTQTMPKALMPIADAPIVEQVMRIYAAQGHRDFILACGYLKEEIVDYVGRRRLPWSVRCVDTGADADTGDRVYAIRDLVESTFHVTYCDGLGDVDLDALVRFHEVQGGLATVTAAPLRSQYGVLHSDGKGRITGFDEKPVVPDVWINGGFFVFDRAVFSTWEGHNLERDVLPALAARGELMMYQHQGFWRSMDTFKDQQELSPQWQPYAERFARAAELALAAPVPAS